MISTKPLAAATFWLLLTTALAAPAAAWVEVTSPSFQVITDGSVAQAKRLAREFEEIREALQLFLPGLTSTDAPVTIYAISNEKAAERWVGQDMRYFSGLHRRDVLGSSILIRLDSDREADYGTAYHEYFHSVTFTSLPAFPLWLNEGIAEVIEGTRIDKKGIRIGLMNEGHMHQLGSGKMFSLEELTDAETAFAAYRNLNKRSMFYAQSWALAHYFMMADEGKNWPKLMQYIELTTANGDEEQAWNEVLGDRESVSKAVWRYLRGPRLSNRVIPTQVKVKPSEFAVRQLTRAEANIHRAAFLFSGGADKTSEVLEATNKALADGLTESPTGLAIARETIGRIAMRVQNWPDARTGFEEALKADPSRFQSRYHLALLEQYERGEGWQARLVEGMDLVLAQAPWLGAAEYWRAQHLLGSGASPRVVAPGAVAAVSQARASPSTHLLLARVLKLAGSEIETGKGAARFAARLALNSEQAFRANSVCWFGTAYGYAAEVQPACESAVARAEGALVPNAHDSRALNRAAMGDIKGALADWNTMFETPDYPAGEAQRDQRKAWVTKLKAGRNPVDQALLDEFAKDSMPPP